MAMKLPMATTAVLLVALLLPSIQFTEAQLGICYGTQSDQLPSPKDVVNLYKSKGIRIMRIYDEPYKQILQAVRGTNIKVVLGFLNDKLQSLGTGDGSIARQWVQTYVSPYASSIKYIVVGNEVLSKAPQHAQYVGPAMKNFIRALNSVGLGGIKVTTAIGMSPTIEDSFPPSAAKFNDKYLSFMQPVVSILESNGSPLMVNVFPYFTYSGDPSININYALSNPNAPGVRDKGNGNMYYSLFDAELDAVYAALDKLVISPNSNRGSKIKVIGSETGHPTGGGSGAATMVNVFRPMSGGKDANIANARTYNQNIINKVKSGKGTPLRPNQPLEVYLYALINENKKPGNPTEHHFGLYTPSLKQKYQLNF